MSTNLFWFGDLGNSARCLSVQVCTAVGGGNHLYQVGKTFMPTMDEGTLIVGIEKLPSVSLEQSAALDLKSTRLS